jgi:hypothetical protein
MGASSDSEALYESHFANPWEILSQNRNPVSQAIPLASVAGESHLEISLAFSSANRF